MIPTSPSGAQRTNHEQAQEEIGDTPGRFHFSLNLDESEERNSNNSGDTSRQPRARQPGGTVLNFKPEADIVEESDLPESTS